MNVTADKQEESQSTVHLLPTMVGSNHKRSPSATPSNKSRITLVEEIRKSAEIPSEEIAENSPRSLEIKLSARKIRWIEHVLGVFCIELPRSKKMRVIEEITIPNSKSEPRALSSPWIVPVHVLSNHVIEGHHLPKPAQCTIDTGNHQGNIVSRDFLVDVLGCPADKFQALTAEEQRGGITAAETKLVPQGAVYLDWYYGASTHIYRNMRFLVSPFSVCDLIIGSRSIEEHQILAVPILTVGLLGIDDIRSNGERDLAGEIGEFHSGLTKKKRDQRKSFDAERARQITRDEKELQVLTAGLHLRNADEALAEAVKVKKGKLEAEKEVREKLAELKALEKELRVLEEQASITISSTSTTKSTSVQRNGHP